MFELAIPILLLTFALILLAAEDVLPTGGALGLLAVGCLVLLLYQGFSTSRATGFKYLAAEVVVVPVGYFLGASLMARTGLGRRAVLQPPEPHEVHPGVGEGADLKWLIGAEARALTDLRPSGMVDCQGKRLDGVSEGGLIPQGTAVRVVRVQSGRLIVRAEPAD